MSVTFVPGLELSRLFYRQAVRPILDRHFPDLPHAAARLGSGSEVLGYDTGRSADHEWGPRLQIILDDDDARDHGDRMVELHRAHRRVAMGSEHVRCLNPTVNAPDLARWSPQDRGKGRSGGRLRLVVACGGSERHRDGRE